MIRLRALNEESSEESEGEEEIPLITKEAQVRQFNVCNSATCCGLLMCRKC
jgi:hypothetical protein